MNITIKYQDFIKLVMISSSLSGEKLENGELLKIFINTLSDKKNKNDIVTIFANALSLLLPKETDEFIKNEKICEHISKFDSNDKELLIFKLYTNKIKYNTLEKIIEAISYDKNISLELNNQIEEHLLTNTKKINFTKALEIGYTPSQKLFYHISDLMTRSNDKKTPYYNSLRNMLCIVYAFNEKFIQLKENNINLFMFDYNSLETYNNISNDYIKHLDKNKHPHLVKNNVDNSALLSLFSGKINTNALSYILHNEITKNPTLKLNASEFTPWLKIITFQTPEHQKNSGFNQLINSLIILTKDSDFFENIIKNNKNTKRYSSLIPIIEHAFLEQRITESNHSIKKIKI